MQFFLRWLFHQFSQPILLIVYYLLLGYSWDNWLKYLVRWFKKAQPG